MPESNYMAPDGPQYYITMSEAMAGAHRKYTKHPELVPKAVALGLLVRTPEDLDTDERLEAAVENSSAMLAEANAQFASLKVAPVELTLAEQRYKTRAKRWDVEYERAKAFNDERLENSQNLFEEVMGMIGSNSTYGLPLPSDTNIPDPPASAKTDVEKMRPIPHDIKQWIVDSRPTPQTGFVDEEGKPVSKVSGKFTRKAKAATLIVYNDNDPRTEIRYVMKPAMREKRWQPLAELKINISGYGNLERKGKGTH